MKLSLHHHHPLERRQLPGPGFYLPLVARVDYSDTHRSPVTCRPSLQSVVTSSCCPTRCCLSQNPRCGDFSFPEPYLDGVVIVFHWCSFVLLYLFSLLPLLASDNVAIRSRGPCFSGVIRRSCIFCGGLPSCSLRLSHLPGPDGASPTGVAASCGAKRRDVCLVSPSVPPSLPPARVRS